MFAAMAYPTADPRRLLTMAKAVAWVFPWDDGVNYILTVLQQANKNKLAIDDGSLYYNPEAVIRYQDKTIALIEQSLGPDEPVQLE